MFRRLKLPLFALILAAGCAASQSARRSDIQVSDAWINTRAENEVAAQVGRSDAVGVSTQDGVVFLDGHVTSVDRAERIERTVADIRGVREVKNNLVIRP